MDDEPITQMLFREANSITADIMSFLEDHIDDRETLNKVRRQLGNILHGSRRRVIKRYGLNDEDAGTDTR